jgi:hypothetical protein
VSLSVTGMLNIVDAAAVELEEDMTGEIAMRN